MSNIQLMTREEALKKIELEKNEEGPIGFFYKWMEGARTELVEVYEKQLIDVLIMGDAMGKTLSEVKPGTPEYQETLIKITQMAQKTKMQVEQELKEEMKKSQGLEDDE